LKASKGKDFLIKVQNFFLEDFVCEIFFEFEEQLDKSQEKKPVRGY